MFNMKMYSNKTNINSTRRHPKRVEFERERDMLRDTPFGILFLYKFEFPSVKCFCCCVEEENYDSQSSGSVRFFFFRQQLLIIKKTFPPKRKNQSEEDSPAQAGTANFQKNSWRFSKVIFMNLLLNSVEN